MIVIATGLGGVVVVVSLLTFLFLVALMIAIRQRKKVKFRGAYIIIVVYFCRIKHLSPSFLFMYAVLCRVTTYIHHLCKETYQSHILLIYYLVPITHVVHNYIIGQPGICQQQNLASAPHFLKN